jgi:hypothetical protein
MRFADAGRPDEDNVLGAFDEGERGEFAHLGLRDAWRKGEVELLEGLDDGEACKLCEHGAGAPLPCGKFGLEQLLEKVGERCLFAGRGIGERDVGLAQGGQAQLLAQRVDAFVLDVHGRTSAASSRSYCLRSCWGGTCG